MDESLSGGTSNLLRMARSGCQSAVAFVALAAGEQSFATATYPPSPEDASLTGHTVDDLVRQLWLDPGLGQGKALVRTVRLGGRWLAGPSKRLAVAAVPLGADPEGRPWGILGVADPEAKAFGLPELELLSRIAQRLASYVRARQEVRVQLATPAAASAPPRPAGPAPSRTVPATDHELAPSVPSPAAAPIPAPQAPQAGQVAEAEQTEQAEHADQTAVAAETTEPWWTVEPGPPANGTAHLATLPPPFPPPPGIASIPAPQPAAAGALPANLLGAQDDVAGLLSLAALLGRVGRLLGAGAEASGELVVVLIDVVGAPGPEEDLAAAAARALRDELRFDDPVSRIGRTTFVAAVPLAPGGASAELVERRLADALRSSAGVGPEAVVRSVRVVADLEQEHDADELLRSAVEKLRAA